MLGHALLRRSEINKHWLVITAAYQYVRRLDVPVQDPRLMHNGEPLNERHHHCKQVALIKWLTLRFAAR